jgi:hypothetical protein
MERLDQQHEALQEPVDRACFQLARTGTMVPVSDDIATLVQIRIGAAYEFVQFLLGDKRPITSAPLPSVTTMDLEVLLTFLLVDYWHFAGHARWRTMQNAREMLDEM